MDNHILKAADARQLVGYNPLFEFQLGRVIQVLPVAAATAPRPKVRTAWNNTRLGRVKDFQRLAVREAAFILGDPSSDALTRNGVGDENRAPVVSTNGAAPMRHAGQFKLEGGIICHRAIIAGKTAIENPWLFRIDSGAEERI
jgi:hypothetical protein